MPTPVIPKRRRLLPNKTYDWLRVSESIRPIDLELMVLQHMITGEYGSPLSREGIAWLSEHGGGRLPAVPVSREAQIHRFREVEEIRHRIRAITGYLPTLAFSLKDLFPCIQAAYVFDSSIKRIQTLLRREPVIAGLLIEAVVPLFRYLGPFLQLRLAIQKQNEALGAPEWPYGIEEDSLVITTVSLLDHQTEARVWERSVAPVASDLLHRSGLGLFIHAAAWPGLRVIREARE